MRHEPMKAVTGSVSVHRHFLTAALFFRLFFANTNDTLHYLYERIEQTGADNPPMHDMRIHAPNVVLSALNELYVVVESQPSEELPGTEEAQPERFRTLRDYLWTANNVLQASVTTVMVASGGAARYDASLENMRNFLRHFDFETRGQGRAFLKIVADIEEYCRDYPGVWYDEDMRDDLISFASWIRECVEWCLDNKKIPHATWCVRETAWTLIQTGLDPTDFGYSLANEYDRR